jgi:hypothetical protein
VCTVIRGFISQLLNSGEGKENAPYRIRKRVLIRGIGLITPKMVIIHERNEKTEEPNRV